MEFPDQLRKPAPTRHPGFDALDDFLWEAGSWDPAVEHALEDFCLDGTDRDLAEAAQRLLGDGLLAEPAMVYRAMGLLADVGALSAENLRTRADRPRDPMRPGGPAIGREAGRIRGIQAVTRGRSGISMVCITGPAGVGKTRLAEEIAAACEQEGATPRLEVRLSRAAVGRELQRRAVNGHEALLDLLLLLGVAEGDVPAIPAERKARYAAELAGMRPVILIDGAIDENQVLDLLPPAAGAVVVTSRRHLPGLFDRGAEHLRLNPLSRVGSRLLIQRCFQPQAMPDDAAITAISAATAGMPVPTIILSRWMATAAEDAMPAGAGNEDAEDAMPAGAGNEDAEDAMPARAGNEDAEAGRVLLATLAEHSAALSAALSAAHRDLADVPSALAEADEIRASGAMAAVFCLLSEDQRAIMRALGLLRLPETGILVTCLATGLSEDRARAALERLADIGLIARASSGPSWIMDPQVADYAHADALAFGQVGQGEFEEMLGRVIGVYRTRAQNLRDLMPAPGPEPFAQPRGREPDAEQLSPARLQEWWAAEWQQERDSIAAVLHAAAASARPALARNLAAAFMDAASLADGRESGWRETDSFMAPIMVIARAADDHGLEARVLERFAGNAERQGDTATADKLRHAAEYVREARGEPPGPKPEQGPDHTAMVQDGDPPAPAGDPAPVQDGDPAAVPAGDPAPRDPLEQIQRTVREERTVAAPGPVLFGAKVYAR